MTGARGDERDEDSEWHLLDGARVVDEGLESRVLVAPGCAAAYGAWEAAAAAAAATVGAAAWSASAVGPLPDLPGLAARSRAAACVRERLWRAPPPPCDGCGGDSGRPQGAAGLAPGPQPLFCAADFRVLALRVYLGDERDDDKVEKAEWVGRGPAAALTELLRRFATAAAATEPPAVVPAAALPA